MKDKVEIPKKEFLALKIGLVSSGLSSLIVFFQIIEGNIILEWSKLFIFLFIIYFICNIYLVVCDSIRRKKER